MALLEVEGVSVQFGGVRALSGVSLQVEAGTVTGLVGPNGAGKTTLFNVITGLQTPTHGRVLLNEEELGDLPPYKRARKGLARNFQRLELFGLLTVRENLEVAADIRRRWDSRVGRRRASGVESPAAVQARLLEQIGLAELADTRADLLSTGSARLVELGRALATEPRLLLLDEPASGQDDVETERFAQLIQRLAADGMGVLIVEHDMDLVMRLCSLIYVLDFGRLLSSGPREVIRSDEAVLRAYLGGATL